MDSINKCYIQLNNGLNISNHTYIRDSNNNTDIKLLLNNNELQENIVYKRGINQTFFKLERKLFEDENIQYAEELHKVLNEQINKEILEKIYFNPDFIVIENDDFSSTHFQQNYFSILQIQILNMEINFVIKKMGVKQLLLSIVLQVKMIIKLFHF